MSGSQKLAGLAIAAALCLNFAGAAGSSAATQAAAAGQEAAAAKPQYTMAEYNSYQAAAAEKNPAQQVKSLDDFVSKYPNSALMIYIYPLYYQAYSQLKNYPKVIEYADKLVAMGDKVDAGGRYQALYARAFAYNAIVADPAQAKTGAVDPALAKSAQAAAAAGLKALDEVKKPDSMTDDAFAAQKKQIQIYFNGTSAQAASILKDYPGAIQAYKAVLALNPDDAITSYRLGLAYSAMTPPQQMDAFWSIARAVTAKGATQAQSAKVKDYLRKLIVNYQQAACDNLTDAELNELLQLASSSPDRPDSYKLPSADDLTAARKDMTMRSVISDLKAGGDKAKVVWLAACGLEFPEVPGKIIDEQLGLLPFKVGEFSGFRIAGVIPGRAVMLKDAPAGAPGMPDSTNEPHIFAAIAPRSPRRRLPTAMRSRARSSPHLPNMRGDPPHHLGAVAHGRTAGPPDHRRRQRTRLGHAVADGGAMAALRRQRLSCRIVGNCARRDAWKDAYPRFRSVRDGIEARGERRRERLGTSGTAVTLELKGRLRPRTAVDAIRAPSARAASFAQTTSGSTPPWPT